MGVEEARLSSMESSIQELQAQSCKFSDWFQECGDLTPRVQKQDAQMAFWTLESLWLINAHQQVGKLRGDLLDASVATQTEQLESLRSTE